MVTGITTNDPEETLRFARQFGSGLRGGEIILFKGALGAGKTLFTKGILSGLGFDPDEVTSPSFALVNHYRSDLEVFHIDLWRLDGQQDPAFSVGLDEILENENAVVIIEWSEWLSGFDFGRAVIEIELKGTSETQRNIEVRTIREDKAAARVID